MTSCKIHFLLLWVLSYAIVRAENPESYDPEASHEIPDTRKESGNIGINNLSSLSFAFDYSSNSGMLGNFSQFVSQPSYSPSVNYTSPWGLDFSVYSYFIDNSDDSLENFTSEFDLVAGYSLQPLKNLTLYASYSRFFFSGNSNYLKSAFSNEADLFAMYDYNFIGLGCYGGFLWGDYHTFYLTFSNSYTIDFNHVLIRNSLLSLQPGLDVNFGDYEYMNLSYIDSNRDLPYFYTYFLSIPEVRRYVVREKFANPSLTYKEILDVYLEDYAEDSFTLTSLSFYLPVYYSFSNLTFNTGAYLFIPFNQPDYMEDDVQFFISAGLAWNIFWGD